MFNRSCLLSVQIRLEKAIHLKCGRNLVTAAQNNELSSSSCMAVTSCHQSTLKSFALKNGRGDLEIWMLRLSCMGTTLYEAKLGCMQQFIPLPELIIICGKKAALAIQMILILKYSKVLASMTISILNCLILPWKRCPNSLPANTF